MAKEIERRFRVSDLSVIEDHLGSRIIQGYIVDEPMTVRVRIIEAEAFLTLKSKSVGIARDEYEFPVPMHQARSLLADCCGTRVIEKTRYRVPYGGLTYEVDVFSGRHEGLVIAEVELAAADQEFALPPWIGQEISHDRRFSNSALSLLEGPPSFDPACGPSPLAD